MVDRLLTPLNTDGIEKENIFTEVVPEWKQWLEEAYS